MKTYAQLRELQDNNELSLNIYDVIDACIKLNNLEIEGVKYISDLNKLASTEEAIYISWCRSYYIDEEDAIESVEHMPNALWAACRGYLQFENAGRMFYNNDLGINYSHKSVNRKEFDKVTEAIQLLELEYLDILNVFETDNIDVIASHIDL